MNTMNSIVNMEYVGGKWWLTFMFLFYDSDSFDKKDNRLYLT